MVPAVPSASGGRPMPPHLSPIFPPSNMGQRRCGRVCTGALVYLNGLLKGLSRYERDNASRVQPANRPIRGSSALCSEMHHRYRDLVGPAVTTLTRPGGGVQTTQGD